MNKIVQVKDYKQLSAIVDEIHDCWFSVKNIALNKTTSVLTIKFEKEIYEKAQLLWSLFFLKRIKIPIVECLLKIYDVKNYRINDTEHIERYDFNKLVYDFNNGQISISTGVPLQIEIDVNKFEVSVEETDNILTEKTLFKV